MGNLNRPGSAPRGQRQDGPGAGQRPHPSAQGQGVPPEVTVVQTARVDPDGAAQRPVQPCRAEQDATHRDDAGKWQLQVAGVPGRIPTVERPTQRLGPPRLGLAGERDRRPNPDPHQGHDYQQLLDGPGRGGAVATKLAHHRRPRGRRSHCHPGGIPLMPTGAGVMPACRSHTQHCDAFMAQARTRGQASAMSVSRSSTSKMSGSSTRTTPSTPWTARIRNGMSRLRSTRALGDDHAVDHADEEPAGVHHEVADDDMVHDLVPDGLVGAEKDSLGERGSRVRRSLPRSSSRLVPNWS